MKQKRHWGIVLGMALAFGLIVMAGCSSDKTTAPSTVNTSAQENLNTPTGGLTFTSEQPGFGDPNLMASAAADSAQADPTAQDSTVRDIEAGRTNGAQVYAVTILWGMLQSTDSGDALRSDGNLYDWSGSVSVSAGIEVLKSTVSFEAGDRIGARGLLRSKEINWVSHTGDGFDGIRFLVYVPPQPGGTDPTLTFQTPLYTQSFPLSQVARMDTLLTVDDNGNKVHIASFLTDPGPSTRGYVQGHWAKMAVGDSLAHFTGLWVSDRGDVRGFVRGHYGINRSGQKVLFAKYVDRTGTIQGIIRGNWAEVDSGAATTNGTFRGVLVDGSGSEKGQVWGVWSTAAPGRSFFLGKWCLGCAGLGLLG